LDKELTGWDAAGNPVYGDRVIEVGDQGFGAEERTPERQVTSIELYGGPLDGQRVGAVLGKEYAPVVILDEDGQPKTDELYLLKIVGGDVFGVYAELVQGLIRSDEVHVKDPELPQAAQLPEGDPDKFRLAIPMCEKNRHHFGPWRRTPRGNKTRICERCLVSQSSIL
jgi:hypothetical protein